VSKNRTKGKKDDHYAFGLLIGMQGADTHSDLVGRIGFVEGLVHGTIHRLGISKSTAEVGQAKVEELLSESRKRVTDIERETKDEIKAIRDDIGALSQQKDDARTELNEKLVVIRGEMEKLKDNYATDLALKRPIIFWATRHRQYRRSAESLGRWAYGSMLCAALFIGASAWFIAGTTPVGVLPEFWRLTSLAAVSALALWFVRVRIRLWFSSLHLATDAEERKLMIETYLSMRRGDFAITEQDSKLVLQHIYRAASDGIVKDDASPTGLSDLMIGRFLGAK
jgi:hypothetical protein